MWREDITASKDGHDSSKAFVTGKNNKRPSCVAAFFQLDVRKRAKSVTLEVFLWLNTLIE